MNILDTLITGREQKDVDRARALAARGYDNLSAAEREEWNRGLRGAYSAMDLNRVVGALEYLTQRMADAGTAADYAPVLIPHKTPEAFDVSGTVTRWREWSDKTWIDYDKPRLPQWSAHLDNIVKLWKQTQTISAVVAPVWDPDEKGYLYITKTMDASQPCQITQSNGLLQLTVEALCDPDRVLPEDGVWTAERTESGWLATYRYPGGPYQDIQDALSALTLRCAVQDGVVDAVLVFRAALRYAPEQELGRCAVRWSSILYWRELEAAWPSWGSVKSAGLSWGQAARGGGIDD